MLVLKEHVLLQYIGDDSLFYKSNQSRDYSNGINDKSCSVYIFMFQLFLISSGIT